MFKATIKTTLLLGIMTGLFLAVGSMLGGRSGMIIAFIFAILFNFGTYWFSDKLVLKMQRAKPLDTKRFAYIQESVKELSSKDGLPMPKLYFVDTPVPNAFATGRNPDNAVVAVTRGITEILNKDELHAVLAHELGHIKNRDMLISTVAATIGGAIAMMAELAFWGGALFGGGDEDNNWLGGLAAMIIAPIAAVIIQMAISRSREFMADAHGKNTLGTGKELALALQKLESFKPRMRNYQPQPQEEATNHLMFANMFNLGGLKSLFSTHPSTNERVARLLS